MLYVKVSRCLLGDPSSRDKRGIGRPGIVTEKHPMAFLCSWSFQLFDLIYREETLFNVIKSVTRNGRSILLTALLALILVYLFSIVGFLFLKDDFILEVDRLPDSKAKGASGRALAGCRAWAGPLLQLDHCRRPWEHGAKLLGALVWGWGRRRLPALI